MLSSRTLVSLVKQQQRHFGAIYEYLTDKIRVRASGLQDCQHFDAMDELIRKNGWGLRSDEKR